MPESEVTEIVVRLPDPPSQEPSPPKNPFLSLISKFLPKHQEATNEEEKKVEYTSSDDLVNRVDAIEGSGRNKKVGVVKYPLHKPEFPPLKLENEEAEKDTNPIVLWQVYALGGFIILRWVWAKWQERKAKSKKDSADENEGQPPTDS